MRRKVEALRKRTGQSTTDIVKASLESYYVAVTKEAKPGAGLAELVGCAAGPKTLSMSYKEELTKSSYAKAQRKPSRDHR